MPSAYSLLTALSVLPIGTFTIQRIWLVFINQLKRRFWTRSIMHPWHPVLMQDRHKVELPDRYNLVDHFVDRHIREGRGHEIAIISGQRRLTYAEIAEQ